MQQTDQTQMYWVGSQWVLETSYHAKTQYAHAMKVIARLLLVNNNKKYMKRALDLAVKLS